MNSNQRLSQTEPGKFDLDEQTRKIFLNTFAFYGTMDPHGRLLDLNGNIFKKTHKDPDLLNGQRFSETVFWQSSESTPKNLDRAIKRSANGHKSKIVLDFRISADKKIAVELFMHPIDEQGITTQIFFCAHETAERAHRVEHNEKNSGHLLSAAENAEIGLWSWDLVENRLYSTPTCNELFEVPADDILTYDSFLAAVHPDDRERVGAALKHSQQNGAKYTEEYRVVYSDGRIEWICSEGRSLLNEQGAPSEMMGTFRKTTEQRLAADELGKVYDREKKARDEAVEANRAKDFFLAFVSHELRSPLNAILGWAKILLTKTVDEATRKNALETIERSARVQTKLINDLVDSARVASGKLRLEFRPTNVYEIVRTTCHSQKPTADIRNITFELTFDCEEIPVFGDSGRLQQVFSNLISNAIKFTPEGGTVSVDIKKGEDTVAVTVKDTGQGISTDVLPTIFRQFAQGDKDGVHDRSSLGLGLSIVKILVGKHGGTVCAASEGTGCGSTFTVTLPLTAGDAPPPPEAPAEPVADGKLLRGLKVLLVEDDLDSREVTQLFLEQSGASVRSAESARVAMALLVAGEHMPDVIVSDLAMPDEDGYSLIKRIRDLPPEKGGRIAALALSAFASNESRQKAFSAGFDKYRTKPFEPDLLVEDIVELAKK